MSTRLKTVSLDAAKPLIDFTPQSGRQAQGIGEKQLEGSVAAFNMLVRNRVAYLADEVGMGKTYVALGAMGLLRYFDPNARVVVIAPRENIQYKWIKEHQTFVRRNWRVLCNRVKSIQGRPARDTVFCRNLQDFIRELQTDADRDFFLRMTSFSVGTQKPEDRAELRSQLRRDAPWADNEELSARDPDEFLYAYGRALNLLVPPIDLLVVDEAHNLKHGFGARASIRNRMLAVLFGHPNGRSGKVDGYKRKIERVLFLSATPFEEDYGAVERQLDIFGFGAQEVASPEGRSSQPISILKDSETPEGEKRELVGRLMLRRVSGLSIAGENYTKNMYRREWRAGGLATHDNPMMIDDPEQRLVVALMQKKVSEVLQDERFNNSFQIGMLSSFESFLESVSRLKPKEPRPADGGGSGSDDERGRFEGEQEASEREREGIDTAAVAQVARSFAERFDRTLPHPKLDAAAAALGDVFKTGEKALVFVRRVATVDELASKLDEFFDEWLEKRMREALPELSSEIDEIVAQYKVERRLRPEERALRKESDDPGADVDISEDAALARSRAIDDDDEGSAESLFAWFFRGKSARGRLSGAAFQKSRLASSSSAYSTLFEDDYVSWLLREPEAPMAALAQELGMSLEQARGRLRTRAYARIRSREKFPKLHVFEAYQTAGLELLKEAGNSIADKAKVILEARFFEEAAPQGRAVPAGFPGPEGFIGIATFFTELAKRQALREKIWPEDKEDTFLGAFRKREQRRELISGLCRLGATYVDLYLLAIKRLGSMSRGVQEDAAHPDADLARDFISLLERQSNLPGFHAFHELSAAAENFPLIVAVNFPKVPDAPLKELASIYGATLQRQVPVGRMWGGVNKRLVRQFRMPGFPLVLVSTDVLQEGEDLHTFCRRILHYGITWTPSAMEQRTGRIDRIESLVQRRLDGSEAKPAPEEFIQVFYPHMRDTVEFLQVRRVLKRLNRFMELIHEIRVGKEDRDSRLNAAKEFLESIDVPQPLKGELVSAFPIHRSWLDGELKSVQPAIVDVEGIKEHLVRLWSDAKAQLFIEESLTGNPLVLAGQVAIKDGRVVDARAVKGPTRGQHFRLELRSGASGSATLLRCISAAGERRLLDDACDELREIQKSIGMVKICVYPDPKKRSHYITVENDMLFEVSTAQAEEVVGLIRRTALSADAIEEELFDIDADAEILDTLDTRDEESSGKD